VNTRLVAAQVLQQVLGEDRSLSQALTQQMPAQDQALVQQLCYGTLRQYEALVALLRLLLRRPLKHKDLDLHCLLLVGLYQLIHMRIPAHAAVYETVKAAQALGKPWAKGLINAALRTFQRHRGMLLAELERDPQGRWRQPAWLLERLRAVYPHAWQDICRAALEHPPMTLRVNRRNTDRSAYLARLHEAGIAARPHTLVDTAVELGSPLDVGALPGFGRGLVSVQDAAAQLAAPLLGLRAGMRVLDACAAPGGKSAHILESAAVELVAVESDPARLARLHETLARVGVRGAADVVQADAASPQGWWDGRCFERILLDAPCTASGVIRRHPDIKLRRRAQDPALRARVQLRLLEALWPLLARGGLLLYATCSILPEETSQVVKRFLSTHRDGRLVVPKSYSALFADTGWQIRPGQLGMDGFYYAPLLKD
jgi:16S rRNA (cytosine967-C5)-methyltransferase